MGGEADSNYKKYGAARDYVYTDSTEYRCLSYALGMDEACYIEDAPLSSITIEEARDMTLAKVKAEGMKIRPIDSYDSPIAYNEYRIALRVSERDYHFMVQHSDGTWSHKPGELPSRRIDGDNPSVVSWDIPNVIGIEYTDGGGYRYIENGVIENVYTGEIVYFAISK